MITVTQGVVSDSDITLINNYLEQASFNTKDKHSPLHNNLFENSLKDFSIVTYGDMGKEISHILDKIAKSIQNNVSNLIKESYDPPILTKSYIMKFDQYNELQLGFDFKRPQNVFRSLVFWNNKINKIRKKTKRQNL